MSDIKKLKRSDFEQIAILHAENINQGFLSSLGNDFLTLLYQAIDESEHAVLFNIHKDGKIVGFVAASSGLRPIYAKLLMHFPALLYSLRSAIFDYAKMKKIAELLFRTKSKESAPAASVRYELLSIAVDSNYRGLGIARELYERLCEFCREHEIGVFKIVVGENLQPAHRFYLSRGAKPVSKMHVHSGEISTLYLQHLLDDTRADTSAQQ